MLDTLRSTLKSTLIYSIGNMMSKLIGFILIPLYTKELTLSEYGVLGILDISAQVLIAVFGISLYNAFFRWYWDKTYKDKQRSIFFTILVTVFGFSVTLSLFILVFRDNVSLLLFDTTEYAYPVILLLLVSCLEAMSVIVLTLIRLREKAAFFSFLNVIKLLFSLGFTVYFVAGLGKKVEGIYEAQVIGSMVFLALSTRFVFKNMEWKFSPRILLEMLSFSLPIILTTLSAIVLTVTDRYVLRFKTDLDQVGIYNLGFRISNTIKVFIVSSVQLALQPVIFKMIDDPNNKRFYSKIMTYFTYGLMFFVLGVSFFGEEIVKVLAVNPLYWEAHRVVPVLSFAILFAMLRDVSLTGINLTKRTSVTAMVVVVVTAINIGLNLILISHFRYMGAAYATLISQLLYFALIYVFAQKYYFIPYELVKILTMVTVGILLYLVSSFTSDLGLMLRLILKTTLIFSFPFILYFLRFYERIELERLGQFWNKWKKINDWKKNLREL